MENVVLVNSNNKKIGVENKLIANQKGLLHRAFSILIFNSKKEFLLQRRADKKYHTPGLWTNTCCSHPKENEDYKSAIDRRLNEEMGMKCNMEKHFSFIYKSYLSKTLTEHEHDTVFIGETNTTPNINTDEDSIENYLQVYYLENNIRRQFPNFNIFNSYVGTLFSLYIEHEIILIEKKDLDFIPLGTPMRYNTR